MIENEIMIRPDEVDGEKDWYWLQYDNGAWQGPVEDWVTSHKEKYLRHVKNKNVVVTAGGNQGLYTRLYSKIFKNVYSFEPDYKNFHCLVLNNQTENVIKMNCGLGLKPEFLSIARPVFDNTGMNMITSASGSVPILPLDSFNFNELNLLQLDVEGYEYNILLGGIKTIKRCKPVIALEQGKRPQILDLLDDLGYKFAEDSVMDSIFIPK